MYRVELKDKDKDRVGVGQNTFLMYRVELKVIEFLYSIAIIYRS
jgi:hypothetical protein